MNMASNEKRLDNSINALKMLSNTLAIRYLSGWPRAMFCREINDFINTIRQEVAIYCLSEKGGVELIEKEIAALKKQDFQLSTEQIVQYATVKKEIFSRKVKLFINQVGFVGGGTQIFAGAGVCAASLGTMCAAYGAPLISHGLNNFYESGYYLLYRKVKSGYTRNIYRMMAQKLGYSAKQADIAYGVIDLTLSG